MTLPANDGRDERLSARLPGSLPDRKLNTAAPRLRDEDILTTQVSWNQIFFHMNTAGSELANFRFGSNNFKGRFAVYDHTGSGSLLEFLVAPAPISLLPGSSCLLGSVYWR